MFDDSIYLANIFYIFNPYRLNLESKIEINDFEVFWDVIVPQSVTVV